MPEIVRDDKGRKHNGYTATPNSAFWDVFRANKDTMKAAGIRMVMLPEKQWLAVKTKAGEISIVDQNASLVASRATDANIEILAPEGLSYLPFQRGGISYARSHDNVLFADEMGLGKTIQAIGVCNDDPSINKVLVVCPAYLKLNWRDEILKWFCRTDCAVDIINAGDDYEMKTPIEKTWFTIVNYDIIQRFPDLLDSMWDAMIVDEAHYVKNEKTKRGKAVHAVTARRVFALTGTPMLNRPAELFSLLKLLVPSLFPNKYFYQKRYCDGQDTGWGFEAKGCSNEAELQQKLRASCMVRRLKTEVLKELPEKQRQTIKLPTTNEIKMVVSEEAEIWKLHEETLEQLKERRKQAQITGNDEEWSKAGEQISDTLKIAFQDLAKVRVEMAWLKVPLMIAHTEQLLESGAEKVIVFWHHKEQAKAFAEKVKGICITGDTPMEERHEMMKRFQTDPNVRVIVGTIGAMGTGVTLTAASLVVFAELDWRPGILMQAEDRAHRIGQLNSVLCQYMLFDKSVDAKMMTSILIKMENAKKVLDRDCGEIVKDTTSQIVEKKPDKPKIDWNSLGRKLTEQDCERIHEIMQKMANLDNDRARTANGAGFNKFDSRNGHEMASRNYLSRGQAAYCKSMLKKYRAQLDDLDRATVLAE